MSKLIQHNCTLIQQNYYIDSTQVLPVNKTQNVLKQNKYELLQ